MHIDIGYDCSSGLQGIRYALFIVDRATRFKYIYPIKLFKNDILPSFKNLIADMVFTPCHIVTDLNFKLMGEEVTTYLNGLGCMVSAAPPRHQHQNGLVKRN